MAMLVHNDMTLYANHIAEDAEMATYIPPGDSELFDRARDEKLFSLRGWTPNDNLIPERLSQEQTQQNSYHQNAMVWGEDEKYASGSFVINPVSPFGIGNSTDDSDQESSDRLILLAKKFATETENLNKEENARLEMINQSMDLRFPRYSAEDWKLLDEAKALINEFSSISGTES